MVLGCSECCGVEGVMMLRCYGVEGAWCYGVEGVGCCGCRVLWCDCGKHYGCA